MVVPFKTGESLEQQKQKRNLALKYKAKQLYGDNTFITGTKVQGKIEMPPEEQEDQQDKDKDFYLNLEDELIAEVNQHESDMNDMFRYL